MPGDETNDPRVLGRDMNHTRRECVPWIQCARSVSANPVAPILLRSPFGGADCGERVKVSVGGGAIVNQCLVMGEGAVSGSEPKRCYALSTGSGASTAIPGILFCSAGNATRSAATGAGSRFTKISLSSPGL